MITNHMLYFADWLNENALQPDASKDSKSSVGCLYWETVDGVGGCMFD